eukprot:TRINITY_DN47793_c0_g1_i1.p1 TRINITY_DN47793_c0_g1~~TRINITY_DN47793_c0_g1_i1.p1  ORF type:complete len:351 (+),score=109.56 TRINITY_DN47793_c0_g1_i1:98-1054(+)
MAKLPPELQLIVGDFTKAVLRECPEPPEGAPPPALYADGSLFRFAAEYFAGLAAREADRVEPLPAGAEGTDLVRRLIVRLQLLPEGEEEDDEEPLLPLSVVLLAAEDEGISEEAIDAVTHLAVWTTQGGQEDVDPGNVGPGTPVNAVHFCALCLSLVPSDGVWGAVSALVDTFAYSSAHLAAALECYALIDDVHTSGLLRAADAVREHPGQRLTPGLLKELCPGIETLGKSGTATRPGSAAPTPCATPMSRPGTAVVVHHPDDTGELGADGQGPFSGVRPVTPGAPPRARSDSADSGSSGSESAAEQQPPPAWVLREP